MIGSMALARRGIGKRDVAIAAVLTALGVLLMYANVHDYDVAEYKRESAVWVHGLLPVGFAIPLFLLVTVPLLWRRVAPVETAAVVFGALVVNVVATGTLTRCGVLLPTTFVLAFTVGSQLEAREGRIAFALVLAAVTLDAGIEFGPITTAVMLGVALAMWGIGRIVRSRVRMAAELDARTKELREARDERARLEVATDRARLSHELDELLQRRLGELGRLASEGARPGDAAAATATLAQIERESRSTLEQMRAVVGVLREDSAEAPTDPQPALTNLEALLLRAKGGRARLTVEGNPRVLPPVVELSAYRIVEQLLDALEDASDVEVRVRFADSALELAVAGPARRRAKAAIERASERARLQHGTLEATVRGGRAEAAVSLPVFGTA